MKRTICFLVAVMVGMTLLVGYTPVLSAADKPIVLKAAAFLPYHPGWRFENAEEFCKRVTANSNGELEIKFLGGSEVMFPPLQFKGVLTGALDISWIPATLYARLIPETISFSVSELSPAEERAVGFYDYINELHKKKRMVYLGRNRGDGFYWTSNKLIKDPHVDFKGLKMAVIGTLWQSFAKELGIAPVSVPIPDIYASLERGVVDGFGIAGVGSASMTIGEVTKYCIDHEILMGGSGATIMNLKSWNKLPKHLQDLIMQEFINYENELPAYFEEKIKKERVALKKQGMQFIKFPSAADAEWYVETAKKAKWAEVKKMAPDSYDKLRGMLIKK